jgi:hypothetical protein
MSYKSRWDNGGWLVICDQCGRKYKESELRLRWDGLMVCTGDWEPRQPQDFVHNGYRPSCTLEGSFAIPASGIPGCMIPSKVAPGLNDFLIG